MKVFITSCGRIDLLERTLRSLFREQPYQLGPVIIHEDHPNLSKEQIQHLNRLQKEDGVIIEYTHGIGQHASIEKFLKEHHDEFVLMLEDDWEFDNSYNWIEASIILLQDKKIDKPCKVLCRKNSPHTNKEFIGSINIDNRFHEVNSLKSWLNNGISWMGFSWNPGVTRTSALRSIMPFKTFEQEVANDLYNKKWQVLELCPGVYEHIGGERSTHE